MSFKINMAFSPLVFIFLCLQCFVNCEIQVENENKFETHSSEITAVLNYLNSSSFKVYDYKEATLLHAQTKADITELALEVSVECINKYPNLPCTENVLVCHAFVRTTPDAGSQVLNDVNCKPKPQIIVEDASYEPPTNPSEAEINETKSIALSNEAVSSEVSEPFVAVRKDMAPCLGCPFDLNPNVEGVDELVDLAVDHVSSERTQKQTLVRVLKLQQQVVSGVKYILVAELGATVCSKDSPFELSACPLDPNSATTVCEIVYLQKPWISKTKHIINNNCTVSQEFVKSDGKKSEMSNEIDGGQPKVQVSTPNFDHIAESGTLEELSPGRLSDLESQIEFDVEDIQMAQKNEKIVTPSTVASPLSELESQIVQDKVDKAATPAPCEVVDPIPITTTQKSEEKDASSEESSENQASDVKKQKSEESAESAEKSAKEPRKKRELEPQEASVAPCNLVTLTVPMPTYKIIDPIPITTPEATSERSSDVKDQKSSEESGESAEKPRKKREQIDKVATVAPYNLVTLTALVPTYKLINPIPKTTPEATSEKSSGVKDQKSRAPYDSITLTELVPKYKLIDPIPKTTPKATSETSVKDQKSSEESGEKRRKKRAIPQLEKISPDEKPLVMNLADFAAAALDKIDDDNHKRIILQILGAKKMVGDDGVYYHLIMRMGISRCLEDRPPNSFENCRDKLFENYTKVCKVQIYVNDDFASPRVVKSQCQNIKRDKNDNNRTNYSRYKRGALKKAKRQIPGGEFQIPKDDEFVVKYLESGLSHLDAESAHENKYKVQEVLSATSQVVSGQIYRIKAKIIVSDCEKNVSTERNQCGILKNAKPKICEFKVYEQLWVPGSRETNITCGEEKYAFRGKRGVRSKRAIIVDSGAPVIFAAKKDALIEEYLDAGLTKLEAGSLNMLKVDEILSVSRQTVAGHIYKIRAKIVESQCPKNNNLQRNNCDILIGSEPKVCTFKVYEALWIPNSRTINITCEEYTPRTGFVGNDDRTVQFAMFNNFIKKYDKQYNKKEFKYRFKVFTDNLLRIRMLNTHEQGTATYGVTKFADLTPSEFSKRLGLRPDLRDENTPQLPKAEIPDIEIPTEFDWRTKGAVTEVKNQQQCGSCWAFSVTGNIEGQYALKHGSLLEFSEQELVDCDTEDQGCNGGLMDTAYRQIEKLGGLETEKDYPYDAQDEKCHFNQSLAEVQLSGAVNISQDESDMAKWLVGNGPISIAINANAMQFYFGGVSHPFKFLCNPKNLDHGVLIVGYGVHTYPLFNRTLPYWTVKNSWGANWGEQGYYRVYRGDGTCGLNQTPSSAIVV